MIITITLNPAIDQTLAIDRLILGQTNRVNNNRTDPGGKGINVSRVLREIGADTLAMGFVSGSVGRFIEASLNEIGIRDDFIHTPGQTRTNVVIVEEGPGVNTTISTPGPNTDPRYIVQLKERLRNHITEGVWVVIAGSIPPPLPADTYVDLIDLVYSCKGKPVLDTSGEALKLGIKRRPILIKPNKQELGQIVGRELNSLEEVVDQAKGLHRAGIEYVIVSLGGDGAVGVSEEGSWLVTPPKVKVGSAVGAGDSMVAGVVCTLASGGSFPEGLRLGTAAGAAAAMSIGTQLAESQDIARLLPQVKITAI